jgi:Holliday junction resolvase RusA-like endonuclease
VKVIRFVVPGKPVGINATHMGGHVRPFAKTPEARAYAELVAFHGLLARKRARCETTTMPVEIFIDVFYADERPDIDACEKATLDALQVPNVRRQGAGIVQNDRQVRRKLTERSVDQARPRVEVTVGPRGEVITPELLRELDERLLAADEEE